MIYENDINLLSEKSLDQQIEELSEGDYYLMESRSFEYKRKKLINDYYSGKIGTKEYSHKSRILVQNILNNLDKVFRSENLPF